MFVYCWAGTIICFLSCGEFLCSSNLLLLCITCFTHRTGSVRFKTCSYSGIGCVLKACFKIKLGLAYGCNRSQSLEPPMSQITVKPAGQSLWVKLKSVQIRCLSILKYPRLTRLNAMCNFLRTSAFLLMSILPAFNLHWLLHSPLSLESMPMLVGVSVFFFGERGFSD